MQELHSLYTIGFTPPLLDGKEHKLEVRMKQPGMTARARKSYVASAERLSGDASDRTGVPPARRPGARGTAAANCCRSPTTPTSRSTCATACCRSSSRNPSPAKFVVSPNAPVQQIWVSALSRSFKLTWSDDAGTFELDGEHLKTLVERLAREQLAA